MTTDMKATTDASGYCSAHQEPCLQCYAGLMLRLQAAENEVARLRAEATGFAAWLQESRENFHAEAAREDERKRPEVAMSWRATARTYRIIAERFAAPVKLEEPTPSPVPAGGSPQQVTRHQQAWGMALKLVKSEHFEILNRYIAQNEAAERELDKLRVINTELVATHNTISREFCKLTEQLQVRLEESDHLPSRFSASAFVNAGLGLHDASTALMVSRRILEESEDAVRKQPPRKPQGPQLVADFDGFKKVVSETQRMAAEAKTKTDDQKPAQLSYEEALDAMGDEVERCPIGGHGYRANPTPQWIEEAEAAMDRFMKEQRSASEVALYDAIRWVLAGVRDELRTKRP